MTFVGFDLPKRYITACALDEAGESIVDIRQLSTALAWIGALPGPVTVGGDATRSWEWLATRLAEQGHTVRVAHAFHVTLIGQAWAKTDPIDARKLAELLRVNLFPAIWIPDRETRRRRQLLRGRAFRVRERTRLKNRIHGHLTAENLIAPGADLYGKGGRAWLATAPLSPVLRAQTERLLTLHDAITREIEGLDGKVKRAAKGNPVVQQLTTMPGVGVFSALFVQAAIGSIDRFPSSHALAAYAGLVPTTRSSGGKTAHEGLGKASNRWRKWIRVVMMRLSGP